MTEPPGGDWDAICVAAAWMVLKAPVRFASCVFAQSWGVILPHTPCQRLHCT
jgi:hypothetical protein